MRMTSYRVMYKNILSGKYQVRVFNNEDDAEFFKTVSCGTYVNESRKKEDKHGRRKDIAA